MIIKVLLIAAALGFAVLVLREKVPGQQEALRRAAGLLVVLAGIVAVLWPDLTTTAANAVGVGRGTDLVLYLLVMSSPTRPSPPRSGSTGWSTTSPCSPANSHCCDLPRSGGGEVLLRPEAGSAVGRAATQEQP